MNKPKDNNSSQKSNSNWFPHIKNNKMREIWFPKTNTSKNSKFKIIIGLLDEVVIIILVLILIIYLSSFF